MRSDRELLELAAKAIGEQFHGDHITQNGKQYEWVEWNPLTADGDALRLAVTLELMIAHRTVNVDASKGPISASEHVPTYIDRAEATRRAIVRAAAEIGAKMQEDKQ